jgi:hypothetical protein
MTVKASTLLWRLQLLQLLKQLLLLLLVDAPDQGMEVVAPALILHKLTQHLTLNLGLLRHQQLLRHLHRHLHQHLLPISRQYWHLHIAVQLVIQVCM